MKTKMNDLWVRFNIKAIELICKVKGCPCKEVTYNEATKLYTMKW